MDRHESVAKMTDIMTGFIKHTQISLPDDIRDRLCELRAAEDNERALEIYDIMFRNLDLAAEMGRPMCQDTGYMQFLIKCGSEFPLLSRVEGIIKDALSAATEELPLRMNVVETFDEINTGTNSGKGAPTIWWEIASGRDDCEIYTYPAGGGSSLPAKAKVLMPGEGYEGAADFVTESVMELGPNACPPLFVGIGIGNSMETAAMNSKHALLKPVYAKNNNPGAAEMEDMIEQRLNESGIGPQGLGGRFTVMGVNIVNTARHPACMGVAVSLGCWVHRRGHIVFDRDVNFSSDTHSGFELSDK